MRAARLRTGAAALAAALVWSCASSPTAPHGIDLSGWHELHTPWVAIASDAAPEQLRALAADLDVFVAVLEAVLRTEIEPPSQPIQVVAFSRIDDYAQLRSIENSAAQMSPTLRGHFIEMSLGAYRTSTRAVLYHEFVHSLMHRRGGSAYPVWYAEGLAEMLSSVHRRDDAVSVGLPPSQRTTAFEADVWTPIADVMKASSTHGMTVEQGHLFYAESWALVHYLHTHRGPDGESLLPKMRHYLRLRSEGISHELAYPRSFDVPIDALDAALREYRDRVRDGQVRYLNLDANELVPEPVEYTITPLPAGRVALRLAEIALRGDPPRAELADDLARRAVALDPANAQAHAVLALCALLRDRDDESDAQLQRALALGDGDPIVHLYEGMIAAERARRAPSDAGPWLRAARAAFERSAGLAPDLAAPFALLGFTYVDDATGQNPEAGLEALRRAETLIGRNAPLSLGFGVLYARLGERDLAQQSLREALAWSHGSEIESKARQLLDELSSDGNAAR